MSKKFRNPGLPIPNLGSPDTPDAPLKPDGYQDRLRRRLEELFRDSDGGGVEILDEGVDLGFADTLNFVGANITATLSDTTGTIDVTFSGGSGGGDTITATAAEDIAIGQFVAVYNASGTPKCRVAKSSSGQGYQADGFCKAAFASGATATIFLPGAVNVAGGTGLTAGDVWLGTDGYATNTAPTTTGYISQQIGVAEDATKVAFEPQPDVLLATAASISYGGTLQGQEFTSSGTFNVPTNVTSVWLTMTGAGGGGASRLSALGGGGGGGGELVQNLAIPCTSGGTLTVTIGAAAAAATGGVAGAAGGDTSVSNGTNTWYARGGKGGTIDANCSGGQGGGFRGGVGGSGAGSAGVSGTAESPVYFGGGGGGAGAVTTSSAGAAGAGAGGYPTGAAGGATASTQGGGGGGANSIWGVGGAGGAGGSNGSNAAATSYGAGGGGAGGVTSSSGTGGTGTAGYVLVQWIS